MTEYSCSVCMYTSKKKDHVINHINKKKSCGPGIKEIIEIPVEIKCKFCDKNFASINSIKYHVKHNCKYKDDAKDEEIKQLKEELKKAKSVTINNTTNYIIVVNNYEDTSLEKITDKMYNKIIIDDDEPYKMIPKLIKQIHFNPDIPENRNIYLSNRNKNNKHLSVYRNGHWEITDKNTEIDNLIYDKETNLSDWVAEKGDKYPKVSEKFGEYLDQKYDDDTAKLMKNDVELLLYNNRHMIKN